VSERVLLTGGTGLVGGSIARALVAAGRTVRALVRAPARARAVLPAGVELVEGDVTDAASLRRAAADCAVVYHAAGLPEQWLADPSVFQRVNVQGTANAIEAALAAGVRRFVYSSTIDVFAAAPGAEYDESVIDPHPKGTAYERSKQDADRLVVQALDRGLPAVFVHPSAVYGPAPAASPGLNDFIARIVRGEIPMLLPGGMPVVYAPDLAAGHLLAETKAAVGARYIFSESYHSLVDIARAVVAAAGRGRVPRVMPLGVARAVSRAGERLAALIRRPPLIPAGQLHFLQWQARPRSARAQRELGWRPTPFAAALPPTIAYVTRA
jgi:dihydroflavonol-4-reductase